MTPSLTSPPPARPQPQVEPTSLNARLQGKEGEDEHGKADATTAPMSPPVKPEGRKIASPKALMSAKPKVRERALTDM